ncbi:probable mitogen-activated protein kinase kinase kinase 12 at C-terminar half [Coccomyxa sp. Obi]|nr:probable mitogen-activated protein kinase kinase kinase 12 at C-terminar half [Coccomyxa sp. Obi]
MSTMKICCCILILTAHIILVDCTPESARLVSTAKELGAALRNGSVSTITIKGKLRLTKETWVPGGTAIIESKRHVVLQSDQESPASAVLDLGTLVDAIHVAAGAHLELRRLRIPNSGNRRLARPSERVRLRAAGIFALWPSITLAKDARMSFSDSVFYYWSDKEWDSCDKFREVATSVLNPRGIPDMLEWSASDTQVYIKGCQNTTQNLINMVTKEVHVGAFNATRSNHTLVCLPDPFQEESGSFVSVVAVCGALATLAVAAAIAHYFGLIRLLPAPPATMLTAEQLLAMHPSSELGSAHDSPYTYHSSAGSHPSRNNFAEDHISNLVRDRQRASIGGLELGDMLGRGSFGKVYKGRWRGAIVAVKIVAHDRSLASLAETLRESALSTSIQHPNVVTTFKVRTVRSRHGSDDPSSAAATWAEGEENRLDEASGDSGRLLMRAMSVAQPGRAKGQSMIRSSLQSPLRPFNLPEGNGAQLEDVHEGDEESEPLSMAMKAGGRRSQSVPADNEEPEPLSMTLKAGRSLPPAEPAAFEDDEPEPLSMAIKVGQKVAQPPAQNWDEHEPLSRAKKAGTPLQTQEAILAHDEPEPLSMAIKAGQRAAQPPAQNWDEHEPLSRAKKAGTPLQTQQAIFASDEEPEPLSMAIKSGGRISASAAADARESSARRLEYGRHQQAVQDSASDMHAEESSLSAAAKAVGSLSATEEDNESQPLVPRAKSDRRLHVIMDADVKSAHMAAGGTTIAPEAAAGGNAAENSSNDERELLSRAVKAGAAQPAAVERPHVLNTPDTASLPAAPGSADGAESRNKSDAATLPARMASVAGHAMNRLLSFRKGSMSELVRPDSARDGTPSLTDSAPEVPSALLTPTADRSDDSPADQMQQAAKGADLLETWLILEYCDQGSFDHAIRAGKYVSDLPSGVLCLMDIAAGMEHLHSLGVLHADLKGANVLMKSAAKSNYDNRGYTCKLADFGLSRVMENNSTHVSTSTYGTAAYMPAELLMEGKMTKAADVYSFAMLMHELLTGQQLFEGMRQSQIICKVITGWRPSVPEGSPPSYVALMSDCWDVKMEQRPVFSAILPRLRGLYRELRTAAP